MKNKYVRVHLPLQQGLRHSLRHQWQILEQVRVHLPLQQGLRLFKDCKVSPVYKTSASASSITTRIKTNTTSVIHNQYICASASSITTRIKTLRITSYNLLVKHRASASSITTRIKTLCIYPCHHLFQGVRVHLPLQQGLRQQLDNLT